MNLIDQLETAIAKQDASNYSALKAQADHELAPLKAAGQKVYATKVEGLLKKLVLFTKFASPQEDAIKKVLAKPIES